jgi:PBP1b-binding outer membrane lipoprotein LpoB
MKTKIIVLLLIFGAVLLSGCTGNDQPSTEENATPEETVTPVENTTVVETPEENVTAVETETPEENVTPEENKTLEENVTPGENGRLNVSTSEIKETPYLVRLINKRASSSSLEIKKGESVSWINMEDKPKRVLTLVSEENLFENTNLAYKRAFTHTFNETGDYHFSVVGQPRMNVTVNVAEP